MRRAFTACLLIGLAALPAWAQDVVTSAAPDSVAVTVYRAPGRDADDAMDLEWLEGYALVTEQRTVTIPAGRTTIRFEGVAAGMYPESAIVSGLPAGVREKNLDADLLSPRSLYARAFGRPVTLRRTMPGSGKVTEEPAVIRSGADGAAIVQTRAGFEVASCGGPDDALVYADVPKDLSARPTLSVETDAAAPARVTLSLSYLAWGFDWQANYVVRMHPGGRKADLAAWVTLASSDSTSFADAETAVVAGEVNREDSEAPTRPSGGELVLHCYLQSLVPPPAMVLPATPAPMIAMAAPMADIVVTAQRVEEKAMNAPVTVTQEGLGDLKLYRVPIPTTVAAHAQKQVALAEKRDVTVAVIYRADVWDDSADGDVSLLLRTRNRKEDGLGLALPGGPVTVFEPQGDTMLLSGEGGLPDKAVGEDVEITVAKATQVRLDANVRASGKNWQDVALEVTNARPVPVRFEARIGTYQGQQISRPSARLTRKDGRSIWAVTIPANGTASLRYRLQDRD